MNIFRTIWTNPRSVFRDLIESRSFLVPFLLLYFGCIGMSLLSLFNSEGLAIPSDLTTDIPMETFEMPLWWKLLGVIFLSPFLTFISIIIYSFVTMLIGKWLFKGIGTFKDLLKVNSTAYLSFIVAIPIFGAWLIVNADSFLNSQHTGIIGFLLYIVTAAFTGIYFFIFNLVGISEAHQISKWRAFFTMIIPTILFIMFVFGIFLLIILFIFILFTA